MKKWYMHNPESILENERHKILRDFDVQTNHLISTRPRDDQQKKKRTCQIVDFAIPADHKVKLKEGVKRNKYLDLAGELADHRVKLKEGVKRNKYLDLAGELKKTMKHESDGDTNCNWHT